MAAEAETPSDNSLSARVQVSVHKWACMGVMEGVGMVVRVGVGWAEELTSKNEIKRYQTHDVTRKEVTVHEQQKW
jgi:hypothetical protein